MEKKKVVIIGSGPAGYTAAIYAARANLEPFMYEGFYTAGGQLMTTTDVENYPGFPDGITGPELMDRCRAQALRFGTEMVREEVASVDLSKKPFIVRGSKTEVSAETLIIATGATARRLDIPGADTFWQKGVTACAVCDGAAPIFRDKDLYVVGGGDTAVEEALFLTKYAKKVYVVHRRDKLRASKIMAKRLLAHEKVEVLWNSEVTAVDGDQIVRSVTVNGEKREAGGLFFAIGHDPNTSFLDGQIELEENRYIKVDGVKTSVPGVFAAGDVHDHVYRQAITAAGSGCRAAMEAEWHLHA